MASLPFQHLFTSSIETYWPTLNDSEQRALADAADMIMAKLRSADSGACVEQFRSYAAAYMSHRSLAGKDRKAPRSALGAKDKLFIAAHNFSGFAESLAECPDSRQWDSEFKAEFMNAKARFDHANAAHAGSLVCFLSALHVVLEHGRAAGLSLQQLDPLARLAAAAPDGDFHTPGRFSFLFPPVACEAVWADCQAVLTLISVAGVEADAGATGIAAAGADTPMRDAPALKQPSTEALKAYRAFIVSGMKQVAIAKLLGTNQGQISRWIVEANAWIAAGNVLPDIEGMTHKPAAVDPAVINLGERQDHRTKRQRPTADNGD